MAGPRRALSQARGAIAIRGEAKLLQSALLAQRERADGLTHGFHSYPARMHPALARSMIAALSQPGELVLDPFCGSGTVLVESMVAGRAATGVDLSPLAMRVAEVHCTVRNDAERARFVAAAGAVVEASLARVRGRVRARAPLSAPKRALYDAHVLLELAGLFEELCKVPDTHDRRAFEIVFSGLLVKFSKQRADSSEEQVVKRIRKGLVSEFFGRKSRELAERWRLLEASVARGAGLVAPRLVLGDARRLSELLAPERYDLVLSSPPYGGTYDYYTHHALRYPWLSLDARRLEEGEIGSRRRLSQAEGALTRWERELQACLRSIASVTKPGASVALLLGDAVLGGKLVHADEQLERLAPLSGFVFAGAASQGRPEVTRGPSRSEHLVLLRRTSRPERRV